MNTANDNTGDESSDLAIAALYERFRDVRVRACLGTPDGDHADLVTEEQRIVQAASAIPAASLVGVLAKARMLTRLLIDDLQLPPSPQLKQFYEVGAGDVDDDGWCDEIGCVAASICADINELAAGAEPELLDLFKDEVQRAST